MLLQETHHKIDALRRIIPDSLIFILDTMDRSLVYCSNEKPACKKLLLSLDERLGIEKVSDEDGRYAHEERGMLLRMKRVSAHAFLGFCLEENERNSQSKQKAEQVLYIS